MGILDRLFGKKTCDAYVTECLNAGYEELSETRDRMAFDITNLEWAPARALGASLHGGSESDVMKVRALIRSYVDFDIPYHLLAAHYRKRSDFAAARAVLDDGLTKCKRKAVLCDNYASVELAAARLEHAVRWWIRSAALQIKSKHFHSYPPFMYLAYVAEYSGLKTESRELFAVTDKIRGVRLDSQAQAEIKRLVDSIETNCIVAAINALVRLFTVGAEAS